MNDEVKKELVRGWREKKKKPTKKLRKRNKGRNASWFGQTKNQRTNGKNNTNDRYRGGKTKRDGDDRAWVAGGGEGKGKRGRKLKNQGIQTKRQGQFESGGPRNTSNGCEKEGQRIKSKTALL